MDDGDLMLLVECGNTTESAGVRALLQANGIDCLVQGELHSAFTVGTSLVHPRVMVARRDLERARTLLASEAVHETTGEPLEGGICAVHEQAAVAICARCGNFLCARCESLGQPPVCESCLEAERTPERPASGLHLKIFLAILAVIIVAIVVSNALQ